MEEYQGKWIQFSVLVGHQGRPSSVHLEYGNRRKYYPEFIASEFRKCALVSRFRYWWNAEKELLRCRTKLLRNLDKFIVSDVRPDLIREKLEDMLNN